MTYAVKEIFYTLQGEGAHAGRPAVFCRFAGCNLWSGRDEERATAVCAFCDTDFVGVDGTFGGRYGTAAQLVNALAANVPSEWREPFVVCTGGEPALQLDAPLIEKLHQRSFRVAVETNGTKPLPAGIDWVCVSPKGGTRLRQVAGDELKLVYPQVGVDPESFACLDFDEFFLQPLDDADRERNTALAIEYCLAHPRWRLSLQTHKYLGIR